jgi:uncharacterized protein (TIGR00369 family)
VASIASVDVTSEISERFDPMPDEAEQRWSRFPDWDRRYFPNVVGLQLEELRSDYCRMRLPYRPELDQPAGVVHGGALATLIDTVVVPAVGWPYDLGWQYFTVQLDVRFRSPVVAQDAIAEGWIDQRGRTTVFCSARVLTEAGTVAADGTLVYAVRPPRGAPGAAPSA